MHPIIHDVSFENKTAKITLSGTLTLPNNGKSNPVALLIAGMGPNDRDATNYYGHKPFVDLANHFAHRGIATLRYDKRGVGKSTGIFNATVTSQDLADDARAALKFLKTCNGIDSQQIGLIGHSEGGLIASMLAAKSPDVAWVILMSGALMNNTNGLVEQTATQLRFDGASEQLIQNNSMILKQVYEIIRTEPDAQKAQKQLKEVVDAYFAQLLPELAQEAEKFVFALNKKNVESRITFYNSPWYRFFFYNNPVATLAHIYMPVLALYGEFDFMAPSIVKPELDVALANNKNYTFVTLPSLNHSLQTCKTGAMAEYATAQEAIAPIALATMADWILARSR